MGEGVCSGLRSAGIMLAVWLSFGGLAAAQATVSRANTDNTGTQATGGGSNSPAVSADARWVAFESTATNLVSDKTTTISDIFLKDRQTGVITMISRRFDGTAPTDSGSFHPSISADGRFVAFDTRAALASDDTLQCGAPPPSAPAPCSDIYVYDKVANATSRVSIASGSVQANGDSYSPQISADGRYVVFMSNASNLVPNDTNNSTDIFLADRTQGTITRLSVSPTNVQGDDVSLYPSMSDDGSVVAFLSRAKNLDSSPDGLSCDATKAACDRLFIVSHATTSPTVARVPLTTGAPGAVRVSHPVVSRDGSTILASILSTSTQALLGGLHADVTTAAFVTYSGGVVHRLLQTTTASQSAELFTGYSLSGNGRVLVACNTTSKALVVYDSVTGLTPTITISGGPVLTVPTPTFVDCDTTAASGDGNIILFSSANALVISGDSNGVADVFVVDRDPDHDGMPSDWETTFGLDPATNDAAGDPDGDGKTNLQEFQAGTNPVGKYTRYLAEGAINAFFKTQIDVFNPSSSPASVVVHYLGENGGSVTSTFTLAAKGYTPIVPGATYLPYNLPAPSFSTVVESDQILAIERTMTWAGDFACEGCTFAYGAHAETAVTSPSTTWYFAEGATHGAFDLFYLLQNPNDTDASVTITYLLPAGQAPIVITYPVTAHSRRTIWVDQEPGLAATDVSAKLVSNMPIFAERAVYLSTPTQAFAGGTDGAGLPNPETKWFIAEGATGGFFDSST
jgi:hypothetical protein